MIDPVASNKLIGTKLLRHDSRQGRDKFRPGPDASTARLSRSYSTEARPGSSYQGARHGAAESEYNSGVRSSGNVRVACVRGALRALAFGASGADGPEIPDGAAAVGRGFGREATMGMERYFEAGEGAKAV